MTRKQGKSRHSHAALDRERRQLDSLFPAVAEWVCSNGWIEIGEQEGSGFVARAIDFGGLVYESTSPRTLADAMITLEHKLARHFTSS